MPAATKTPRKPKLGHVPISLVPLARIFPSPENNRLYRPVTEDDPDVQSLADSIRTFGVREPLVITTDNYILSGHRRHAAAQLAGLEMVPVRVEPICRADDIDRFTRLLREYNRQREKSHDEKLREVLVESDPTEAYQTLIEHRTQAAHMDVEPMKLRGIKERSEISAAKRPFLDAVLRVLSEREKFWPLSDRQIHYALLNDPPLIHAKKPKSTYANTKQSYKSLVDLLTRARLADLIPMHAIADETRPVSTWDAHRTVQGFLKREMDGFLKGYWRDLMQSQPNHVEIVGEKNTVLPIIKPVAAQYCIPLTTGRGYCSLPPRAAIAKRFWDSGKGKLVLLILSDFDPDGEEIAHSFARSLRDDFGIAETHPIKVALTSEQVKQFQLPPVMKAKETSVHHGRFVEAHGDNVFELEALAPDQLQTILREAMDSVIDVEAFNRELDAERQDATYLDGIRRVCHQTLAEINLGGATS